MNEYPRQTARVWAIKKIYLENQIAALSQELKDDIVVEYNKLKEQE